METSAKRAIEKLFKPQALAVVGASGNPRNLGTRSLKLIKAFGYAGRLYAINPRGEASNGIPGHRRIGDIGFPIDLCLIAVPAKAVLDAVADCVATGVPVAQILTSGFGEAGIEGQITEQAILEKAARRTRLVGPNCLGVYSVRGGLTFVSSTGQEDGKVSVASQSGGLSVDMLLQAKSRGLRIGKLVSIGNSMDLDPVDFLEYFGEDPETEVIGLYVEGVCRGRAFFDALRKVATRKPVVLLKGGRTILGAKSVASHTNVLAGEYTTWQAVVSQAGAISVDNVDEFLGMLTAVQSFVPPLEGRGIALVGNGGGATVLATDLLVEQNLTLAHLHDQTRDSISEIKMPAGSSVGNPTDTPVNALNKRGSEALGSLVNCLLSDPAVNGVVVHFNLLPLVNYDNMQDIAEGLSAALLALAGKGKPVYVALRSVPEAPIDDLRRLLMEAALQAQLPCFQSVNEAIRAMGKAYRWKQKRTFTQEDVDLLLPSSQMVEQAGRILARMRAAHLKSVPQDVCFEILGLFGISHPQVRLARNSEEALRAAVEIGFPVALKVDSPDILHKTEAGGVRVGLYDRSQVENAFADIYLSAYEYRPGARIKGVLVQAVCEEPVAELILGLKRDAVFGPILVLGMGGVLVEVLRDVSIRILPLAKGEPAQMWREIAGSILLTGYRGQAVADTASLEKLIKQVAILGEAIPEICEMDLNPVMVLKSGCGLQVVDCRILLDY